MINEKMVDEEGIPKVVDVDKVQRDLSSQMKILLLYLKYSIKRMKMSNSRSSSLS